MVQDVIIQTEDLTKIYGQGEAQVIALDGVNIHIHAGECVAIMGPSGSGKSTLMHILGCLSKPTSGKYVLAEEDVSMMNRVQLAAIRNEQIGFVFQSFNLLARTSALNNVMLPLLYNRANGMSAQERLERSQHVLDAVGLADRMTHQPQELSGGQQQRVAIARALVNDPVLILADEPTGNLDSKSGLEIMELLHTLHAQGRTIVVVTHDPEIAEETERTISLLDGRVDFDKKNGAHKANAAGKVFDGAH
jgi:putative ABC transport system ATP-binding protein